MNKYLILLLAFIFLTAAGCWDKSKPPLPRPTVSASLDTCNDNVLLNS